MNDKTIGEHAVVLGGGIAGLLGARVLAHAYNGVTVIERDQLSASAEPRRGVPQGRQIHGLIARGQQALDELFPGFTDDLAACGIPTWISFATQGCTSADTVSHRRRAAWWSSAPAGPVWKPTSGNGCARCRLRPGALGHDRAIIAAPTPGHLRGAGLAVIEGQRHIVTLMGMLGDRPPTDLPGFPKSLRIPDVYHAIVDAEPLDELVGFSFPASVRRRYERMRGFPDGLLVMGDGNCSLNPIYGQGMSMAAIEALTLREHLKRGHEPRPRRVLRDFAKAIDAPWEMAAGADLAFPGVVGRRNAKTRMANAYIPRLHAAAAHDAALAIEFLRVAGLVEHPAALFRPSVVMRVIKRSLRPNRHAAEGSSPAAGLLA